jgi:hypothetical protein
MRSVFIRYALALALVAAALTAIGSIIFNPSSPKSSSFALVSPRSQTAQASRASCTAVCGGLVGYWTLDDGSGSVATDSSGNGDNGALANFSSDNSGWVSGAVGSGALQFNGTDEVTAPDLGASNPSFDGASFTIAFWFKTTAGPNSVMVGLGRYRDCRIGWNPAGSLNCTLDGSNSNLTNSTAINDGSWHHAAFTVTPSQQVIYIDGVQKISGNIGSTENTPNAVTMGNRAWNDTPFNGTLDDVRVYGRALSAGEISQLFALGNAGAGTTATPPAAAPPASAPPVGTPPANAPPASASTGPQTYYIDFSTGSDANNGISESTPWQRAPGMQGFTGAYVHHAGDRFIFKGGVTWLSSAFPMTIGNGGTAGNSDYYGVDKAWFTGASWAKPILDGQYAVANVIVLQNTDYLVIDNLEISHISTPTNFGNGLIAGGCPQNLLMENLYLHGWRTTAASDDAHGAVIFNYGACAMNSWSNVVLTDSVVTNSENSGNGTQNGVALRQVQTIENSTIHDVSSAVLFTANFNNNSLYNVSYPDGNYGFDQTYHTNGIYLDGAGMSASYVYGNRIHDISGGANQIYPNPHGGQTDYIFNNIIYGVQSAQLPIEIDTYDYGYPGSNTGIVYVYNNTIVNYKADSPAIHVVQTGRDRPALNVLVAENNQVIGTGAYLTDAIQGSNVNSLTANDNLIQDPTTASSQGYALSGLYAPAGPNGSTVGAGTAVPCPSCSGINQDVSGKPRPQSQWDIGAYQYASGGSQSDSPLAPIVTPIPTYIPPIIQTPTTVVVTNPVAASPNATIIPVGPFARALSNGMNGVDVRTLQQFLNTHGFPVSWYGNGSPGHESSSFGHDTLAALSRFQAYYGVDVVSASFAGSGILGQPSIDAIGAIENI